MTLTSTETTHHRRAHRLNAIAAGVAGPFTWWVTYGIYPWFLAWGVTLAVAVWSYQYRTRGACLTCGRPPIAGRLPAGR